MGRKIYFNKLTGNILLDTGERMGNVRETTLDEDMNTYSILQQSNFDYIQLPYGYKSEEFSNMGSYKIDITTRELIIYPRLTIQTDKPQIQADTLDTTTITVNTQNDCAVKFQVNDGTIYDIQTINKVATFQFSTDIIGTHIIKATNDLYGANSVQVEAI